MTELKDLLAELHSRLSKNHKIRKAVVSALAEAFIAKGKNSVDTRNLQEAQLKLRKEAELILNDLDSINTFLMRECRDFLTEPTIASATRIVEEEMIHFQTLKDEFFNITKSLRSGIIDMTEVNKNLQVDKIIATVSRLNVLVGNIRFEHESEEYLLKDINRRAA